MEFNNLRIPFILEKKIFYDLSEDRKVQEKNIDNKRNEEISVWPFLYFFKSPAIYHDGQYHKVIISSIDFEALDFSF